MREIWFEGRALQPYAVSIDENSLGVGKVYFKVTYEDSAMLTPTMQTLVFLGQNILAGDADHFYFQDARSCFWGARYDTATEEDHVFLFKCSFQELGGIYEFDEALNELLRCSLRRRSNLT